MSLERWLLGAWYGGVARSLAQRGFSWVMAPFGWLTGQVAARRRRRAATRAADTEGLPPVVVIGNLTVGGTGKTPVVAWLAEQLRAGGQRVGIVSRGHGRRGIAVRRVRSGDDAAAVGDEPAWLARATGCAVAVGQDRRAAAALLAGEVGVVLADDGLQHHALPRRLELVVVDMTHAPPLGNGRCLPAGPLREQPDFLGPGHVVLCNHGAALPTGTATGAALPWARRAMVLRFAVRSAAAVNLRSGERRSLAAFPRACALAGIGHPARFFAGLRAAGVELMEAIAFPDHHAYSPADLARWATTPGGAELPVLMTAKDAVKCAPFAADHWWSVETELVFAPGDGERLLERVRQAIG